MANCIDSITSSMVCYFYYDVVFIYSLKFLNKNVNRLMFGEINLKVDSWTTKKLMKNNYLT